MAKKTKKEKIIADLRRKVLLSRESQTVSTKESISLKNFSSPSVSPLPPVSNHNQTQSLYIYPLQLIRKDLTKTLLLSILTISLEIALFLILEKHLILPFEIKL